jgi:hypothetical protein
VNVTGAGVDVADATTDANGTATVTVNASDATEDITVEATKDNFDTGTATVAVQEAAGDATFELSNLQVVNQYEDLEVTQIPDGEAVQNENITVQATLNNAGSVAGSTDVEFEFGDGVLTETVSVSDLGAGNTTTVYVDVQLGTDVAAGNYAHGFSVVGGDSNVSADLTLRPIGDVNHDGTVNAQDALNVFLDDPDSDNSPSGNYNRAGGDILDRNGATSTQEALEVFLIGPEGEAPPQLTTFVIDKGTQ